MIKLNDIEQKVLEVLADSYDYSGWDESGFWSFDPLSKKTGVERKKVRLACRSLTRKGLAKYANALWSDDSPAGAGYGATREGAAFINPCDICGKLAEYDWYKDKNGVHCLRSDKGAERVQLCHEHYKEKKYD